MAAKTTKKTTTKSTKTTKKATTPVRSRTATSAASSTTGKPAEQTTPAASRGPLRIRKSYFLTALGILLFVALLYLLRNLIVAAVVNNQPISRLSVIQELERQGGKQALDSLITKTVIMQEARKKNITVAQADIDGELKKIDENLAKQGQKLDQVLQLQGMTKEQLVEQIRLQKMIEKMIGTVAVSDKEITDYVAANQESLPQDQDEASLRNSIKTQLQQQKLNEKAQKFVEDLRARAKINRYVNY